MTFKSILGSDLRSTVCAVRYDVVVMVIAAADVPDEPDSRRHHQLVRTQVRLQEF